MPLIAPIKLVGTSIMTPRRVSQKLAAPTVASMRYWTRIAMGCAGRNRRKTKSGDTHHQYPDNQYGNGKVAVLPRCPRRAEDGERHQDKDEGIDRRKNPVVQFGPEFAREALEDGVVWRRRYQVAEGSLARAVCHVLNDIRELRQVKGITVERNKRRVALAGFEPLQVAVLKNEVRASLVF